MATTRTPPRSTWRAQAHSPTGESTWKPHNFELRLPKSIFRPGSRGNSKLRPLEVDDLTSE
eukprot:12696792-Alexandrium_andersonii.AAC.1